MVAVADLPYPITIAARSLDDVGALVRAVTPHNRTIVITDKQVAAHYARRVTASLQGTGDGIVIAIPAGEKLKTRDTWADLTDALLEHRFGRDTTIIALGGGVIGDLAGFVAATYMRGVSYVQVPTTLLAMVDASVGGKTGVDTPRGKNLVGSFHPPAAVLMDPLVLETLPIEHLRAGFAEIIKHGVVADAGYFDSVRSFLERPLGADPHSLERLVPIIAGSVEIKAGIVSRDERESGLRKVLNFGHTIGHAVEAATDYRLLHGEAVAIGMAVEARIAERIGTADGGTAAAIERVIRAVGLPTAAPPLPAETILGFTRSDKKSRGGRAEYALPVRVGEMAGADHGWGIPVDDVVVREALDA